MRVVYFLRSWASHQVANPQRLDLALSSGVTIGRGGILRHIDSTRCVRARLSKADVVSISRTKNKSLAHLSVFSYLAV